MHDSFVPLYSAIVNAAETNAYQSDMTRPCFTLEMGVIGPLYEVARNCRDPNIRRRIIRILRDCRRQEGLLSGSMYAQIIQTIVDIEEFGLENVETCADIPFWARISNISLHFDVHQHRLYIFYRSRTATGDVPTDYKVEVALGERSQSYS